MDRQIIDKPIGFNVWDEEATLNHPNTSAVKNADGSITYSQSNQRLYFEVVNGFKPNTQYYLKYTIVSGSFSGFNIRYTDGTIGEVKSNTGGLTDANKTIQQIDSFWSNLEKITIKNICINISQPDTSTHPCNGDYVQYGYSYDGTPIQQTEYKVLETCGQVDLGTLNWSLEISNNRYIYFVTIQNLKPSQNGTTVPKWHCPLYTPVTVNKTWVDKDMSWRTSVDSKVVAIVNNDYTSTTAFKQAMQGVILTYELANPATYLITETP